MKRFRCLLALIPIFIGGSCNTSRPLCDICTTSAIIYGSVHFADGAVMSGARVSAEAMMPNCGANVVAGDVVGFTDARGQYRGRLRSLTSPQMACLIVLVEPSDSVALRAAADTGHLVRLEADFEDVSHDSVSKSISFCRHDRDLVFIGSVSPLSVLIISAHYIVDYHRKGASLGRVGVPSAHSKASLRDSKPASDPSSGLSASANARTQESNSLA